MAFVIYYRYSNCNIVLCLCVFWLHYIGFMMYFLSSVCMIPQKIFRKLQNMQFLPVALSILSFNQ